MKPSQPGRGGVGPWRVSGERYQRIANATQITVTKTLIAIARIERERDGANDGGPIIAGAIGGLLDFWLCYEVSDDEVRRRVAQLLDELTPQIRMNHAAEGHAEGRA